MDTPESFEALMSDPRLVELCELQRTGDEAFDVVNLTENQHSDILAWMLDAREGHGQSDAILRDLLIHASSLASEGGTGLDGRGYTAKFFAAWPPSRILTTSFASAFSARELGLMAKDRVDLFIVDVQNLFVIVLENKTRGTHTELQLKTYREQVHQVIDNNTQFRDYSRVFLALDHEFDEDELASRPGASVWLHLGYGWLETSAKRAQMHVARGNAAARLVVSYCNRQTAWESESKKRSSRLAADLFHAHPQGVREVTRYTQRLAEREWLTCTNKSNPVLLFILQNKGVVEVLREAQGMGAVYYALVARFGATQETADHGRAWAEMCPTGWQQFANDEYWPVVFNIRYSPGSSTHYTLSLIWRAKWATSQEQATRLQDYLAEVEPLFLKHRNRQSRRVVLGTKLDSKALLACIERFDKKLGAALPDSTAQEAFASGGTP